MKYRILELKLKYGLTWLDIASFCQVVERLPIIWSKIDIDDASSIPADKLMLLAALFKVEPKEMYHPDWKLPKGKGIHSERAVKKVKQLVA